MSEPNTTTAPEAVTPPEVVELNSLDQFVTALVAWHERKVASLKHMAAIPEGIEISVQVGGGEQKQLSGDLLEGFKHGLAFALGELGELPFQAELEYDDSDEAVANATAAG